MPSPHHEHQIIQACDWIERNHDARERIVNPRAIWGGRELPDALLWRLDGKSYSVESKISVSDFHADATKPRFNLWRSPGLYHYYIVPVGLIEPYQAEQRGSGLLVVDDAGEVAELAEPQAYAKRDRDAEIAMLLNARRRDDRPARKAKRGGDDADKIAAVLAKVGGPLAVGAARKRAGVKMQADKLCDLLAGDARFEVDDGSGKTFVNLKDSS